MFPKKQKILIICGPDRVGKSHIAKKLAFDLKIEYYKAGTEHETFLNSQLNFVQQLRYADPARLDLIKQCKVSLVCDRAYPCEFAYSQYFKRETDLELLKTFDSEYAKLDARIVICTRKSFQGIVDDLDPNINEHSLQEISSLYQKFAKWTKCKCTTLYVDDEDLKREVKEIKKWLKNPEYEMKQPAYSVIHMHHKLRSAVNVITNPPKFPNPHYDPRYRDD